MANNLKIAALLAGLVLALQLSACAAPDEAASGSGAEERAAALVELEGLGLRNIAALRVNGPISEGFATYQAERVRFLYDARDGNLRTYDLMPPVP